MDALQRKLNSSRGASMILAMVFMLICLFVGGSVLTAATVSGQRLQDLNNQQQYLDQRSAALLLAEELRATEDQRMKLTVYDSGKTVRFSLSAPQELTAMQRVVYEAAIRNYLQLRSAQSLASPTILLENFRVRSPGGSVEEIRSPDQFWVQGSAGSGEITVEIQISGPGPDTAENPGFRACFLCDSSYHCSIDFTAGEKPAGFSPLEIRLEAYVGTYHISDVTQPDKDNGTMTVISWLDPRITKGTPHAK